MEELLDRNNIEKYETSLKRKNQKDVLITLIYFLGGGLSIFTYQIYKETLIDCYLLFIIYFVSGILCIPFSKKYVLDFYPETTLFNINSFSIIGMGGLILCLFMSLNRYVSFDNNGRSLDLPILAKGYTYKGLKGRCAKPWLKVKIGHYNKIFKYPCDYYIADFQTITLSLKKGFFGFDFIVSQELRK